MRYRGICVLGLVAASFWLAPPAPTAENVLAPNFIGRQTDGQLFRLKDISGPKVVNFFLDTCLPCIAELPELAALEDKYTNVRFIAVHIEQKPEKAIVDFLARLKAHPDRVVIGNERIAEMYGVKSIPHTVAMDGDNIIALSLAGYTKNNISALEKWLGQMSK
ncbi:MAG: TlpA family protein disulfide reductase [Nitrospinota bacterium]|nr:TlpA family protein disulfide reductase [Nitrospinota bacterium]